MSLKFTTVYHKEGKWYVISCPDLGVVTQGKTLDEAKKNIKEAIELYLEDAPKKDLKKFKSAPFFSTIEINSI